jgi:hypothetical protein
MIKYEYHKRKDIPMEKRLTVLVDSDLLIRFKARVALKNLTMSDVVRDLIEGWLDLQNRELREKPLQPPTYQEAD